MLISCEFSQGQWLINGSEKKGFSQNKQAMNTSQKGFSNVLNEIEAIFNCSVFFELRLNLVLSINN